MTTDRHKLITETAAALSSRRINASVAQVAAELLTEMSNSDRREVRSRMIVLLQHLIKWSCQPHQRSPSWTSTIITQRRELSLILEESPSLVPYLEKVWTGCWPMARRDAIEEMKVNPYTKPPSSCPWTLKGILNPKWLP